MGANWHVFKKCRCHGTHGTHANEDPAFLHSRVMPSPCHRSHTISMAIHVVQVYQLMDIMNYLDTLVEKRAPLRRPM